MKTYTDKATSVEYKAGAHEVNERNITLSVKVQWENDMIQKFTIGKGNETLCNLYKEDLEDYAALIEEVLKQSETVEEWE